MSDLSGPVTVSPSSITPIPLIGNPNNGSLEDFCIYTFDSSVNTGKFACDTNHDGTLLANEAQMFFSGVSTDKPFIGNFDGNGSADVCVYRTTLGYGQYICDTNHNSSYGDNPTLSIGLSTDTPLMGDIDGNGNDDLCLFRTSFGFGQVFCDTSHDGNVADYPTMVFGAVGDISLIGNMDGR